MSSDCFGESLLHALVIGESGRSSCDEVDFNQRAVGEARHADAGAGQQATFREITSIDPVHGRIVLPETRQINPRKWDWIEATLGNVS